MERVVLVVALVLIALAAAAMLRRRQPDAPVGARDWEVPAQIDRADFVEPSKPWLVAVFTSNTCDSCESATAKASVVAGPNVAYQVVPWQERKDLHERYGVEVVPMILVADVDGVVQRSFIGVPSATDLWAAVAEARS
ncbi:MAG: hypothetical protein ACLGHT_03005 [Acidimicrobiia bacterium]